MKQTKGCPLEKIWGIVLPLRPAKVLQIPSSLFCNKFMFALLKREKKKILAFPCMQSETKENCFKSGNRGGVCGSAQESVAVVLGDRGPCYSTLHILESSAAQRAFSLDRLRHKTLHDQSPVKLSPGSSIL